MPYITNSVGYHSEKETGDEHRPEGGGGDEEKSYKKGQRENRVVIIGSRKRERGGGGRMRWGRAIQKKERRGLHEAYDIE